LAEGTALTQILRHFHLNFISSLFGHSPTGVFALAAADGVDEDERCFDTSGPSEAALNGQVVESGRTCGSTRFIVDIPLDIAL